MMAVDERSDMQVARDGTLAPPLPPSAGAEHTRADDGSCQLACSTLGCDCEWFQKCIGRAGHRRRPHSCRIPSCTKSMSSSSWEPRQIDITDAGDTPTSGVPMVAIPEESLLADLTCSAAASLREDESGMDRTQMKMRDHQYLQVQTAKGDTSSTTPCKTGSFATIRGKT